MSADLSAQLSAWLAATDIGLLELQGPGVHLCLRNDGGQVQSVPPGAMSMVAAALLPVKATSVGIFLHQHPLHIAPLAAAGQPVAAGQAIGLLQVGALLLPVVAPQDGVLARHRVGHGTLVGWGSVLADLIPSPST